MNAFLEALAADIAEEPAIAACVFLLFLGAVGAVGVAVWTLLTEYGR
jgi:hypothetical protein